MLHNDFVVYQHTTHIQLYIVDQPERVAEPYHTAALWLPERQAASQTPREDL